MNILFLTPEIPYPLGCGHHLRSYNVLRILAQKHRIYMIAFAQNPEEFAYAREMEVLCRKVTVFPVARTGLNFRFAMLALRNLFSPAPLSAQRYYHKQAAELIGEYLRKNEIDLVHADMLALGLYCKEIKGVPVILTDHNIEFLRLYRWMQIERNPFLKLFLYFQYRKLKSFEKKICAMVNHCTLVSKSDREVLRSHGVENNFSVIPNGVDVDYFHPLNLPMDPRKLIWVGGMGGPYNADAVDYFLREIWPLIRKVQPDCTVDFAGSAPTALLQKCAAADPRLRIMHFIPDIRESVQKAALFIAPIRSGSGTKIKVLNAMAQGKAVVATPVAAEGIEVTDGENIFIAEDPKLFAQRVIDLIRDPSLASEMGLKARDLIEEKYSWHVIAEDLHQLYEGFDPRPIDSAIEEAPQPTCALLERQS